MRLKERPRRHRSRRPQQTRLDKVPYGAYKPIRSAPLQPQRRAPQVAQLVEHATENRSVGGSIPPLGTILHRS